MDLLIGGEGTTSLSVTLVMATVAHRSYRYALGVHHIARGGVVHRSIANALCIGVGRGGEAIETGRGASRRHGSPEGERGNIKKDTIRVKYIA